MRTSFCSRMHATLCDVLLISWYSIVSGLTWCAWKKLPLEKFRADFCGAWHDFGRFKSHQSCLAIKRPASGLDKSISHSALHRRVACSRFHLLSSNLPSSSLICHEIWTHRWRVPVINGNYETECKNYRNPLGCTTFLKDLGFKRENKFWSLCWKGVGGNFDSAVVSPINMRARRRHDFLYALHCIITICNTSQYQSE